MPFDVEFGGEFGGFSQLVSKSIELNNKNIVSAKILLSASALSNSADFSFYLSNDGGSSWESATINESHTFANATGQDVRYKIEASSGAVLKIRQTDGSDTFIKVIING